MDGSFETAYVSPTIKTEDRWGREDVMGGRQGVNDSYRGRRSPGKTSDTENMNHLPSDSPVLFNSSFPFFAGGTIPQEKALLYQKIFSALSEIPVRLLFNERHS